MRGKGRSEGGVVVIWFYSRRRFPDTGGCCTRGLDCQEFGLDIIKVRETKGTSDQDITKVAVGCRVDFYDKGRKEDVHSKTIHTNETTTALTLMGPKAVERVAQVWYVEAVSDEDFLPIEGDDGRAVAKDWSKRIVAHSNPSPRDRMVRDECRLIREHVIGGSCVRNQK